MKSKRDLLAAADAPVRFERRGNVGIITLNQPDNRNAMSPALLAAFQQATTVAREESELRAVVVTGSGSCFSAGADLTGSLQPDGLPESLTPGQRSFAMYEPFLSVLDIEVPVLAAVNGHAVGGGFGLSLCCDIRIASASAKLGANFVRIGITPGLGITARLPALVGMAHACELLLSGKLISGERAAEIGLVSRAVKPEDVWATTWALAQDIASAAPQAVRHTKQLLQGDMRETIRAQAEKEAPVQAAALDSADAKEGLDAFLNKRSPQFRS